MAAMMIVVTSKRRMGDFTATPSQRLLGWTATVIMGCAVAAMFILL
jgi:hypothetical protein